MIINEKNITMNVSIKILTILVYFYEKEGDAFVILQLLIEMS